MSSESGTKTYLQGINEAIAEEMERDENVILFGADVGRYGGAFGVTRGLLERFGSRIIDTPISENSVVGLATGAAMTGLRPIVEIMFMDFITLAMDQIVNHATKFRYMYGGQVDVPLVIRTPSGGGRGYGPSHSQSLEAWFMHVPGLKIAVPSNPHDAKWLLKSAIRDPDPWLFIENKKLYSMKGNIGESLGDPVGKAKTVHAGTHCTVITYSRMTQECLGIVEPLAQKGISLEIIDLRTLYPLDMETITDSIKKTRHAVVVEEDCKTAGVGAEVVSRIIEECFHSLSRPVLRIACPDVPIPTSFKLENLLIPNSDHIMMKIEEFWFQSI
jgi:pyruvate dehydrogenase E1 component beta subunit